MDESYDVTLTLWPATPLSASVAHELQALGVNLSALTVNTGRLTARRTAGETVVLDLSFGDCRYGLTDLEAVLATLRLAGISYVAWDTQKGQVAGTARSFDPSTGIEQEFTVMADGEPVLTASDLEEFEGRYDAAEGLIEGIRAWLRLPIPENLTELAAHQLTIVTVPDDGDHDELVEIIGDVDGPPGACLRLAQMGDAA